MVERVDVGRIAENGRDPLGLEELGVAKLVECLDRRADTLLSVVGAVVANDGVALGQADVFVNVAGGVRIDEPGADLAVALAIASAARGVAIHDGLAAFGEIGLTGRLRPATQAARRLEECAKLGLARVLAPTGTPTRGAGPALVEADTIRRALSAGLEQGEPSRD